MAKRIKEELSWVTLNVATLPATLQAKHEVIRGLFDQLKVAKQAFEQEADALLVKTIGPAMVKSSDENVAAACVSLKLDSKGKFPTDSVRKFSYMRGIAVATAGKAKSKVAGGISLS